MKRRTLVPLALVLALAAASALAVPQEPKPPEASATPEAAKAPEAARPERPRRVPPTLLRVEVVLSRYQGEKKISSVPYGFLVTDDKEWVKVRMGVEVPVPVTTFTTSDSTSNRPATSFQYRSVGTNIDCMAKERMGAAGSESFQLSLKVENSSVLMPSEGRSENVADVRLVGNAPVFRSFNISLSPVLRDGQSVQTVASTDPVSGEVVKIDVTLKIVK